MSVVIRGMKMPETCDKCDFCIWSNYHQTAWCRREQRQCFDDYAVEYREKRAEFCPMSELPAEHGRLGDLEAMAFDESEAYMSAQAKLGRDVITTGINSIVHRKIQLLIMDTPTIIEAEGVRE